MFDAYTARKAAPRLVLAVIGINLSIYLCLGAIDITNVVGRGVGHLLSDPFIKSGTYDFGIKGNVSNAAALPVGAGIFAAAGGLGAAVGGIAALAAAPLAVLGMLLILMIPIMLVALSVMITIVIRQGLLIFLTIVSPVAIACYVLPGTEKYFKQWLDLFTKTLVVYPIIAAIFAMSDVFGSIIFRDAAAGSGPQGIVKIITGVIVIYAPLVLIPFAFRFAGGAMGKVAGVATSGAGRVAQMGPVKGRRDIAKRELNSQMVQNRADLSGRLQTYGSRNRTGIAGRATNRVAKGLAGSIGGYNIEEQSSALRAQTAKIMNDQIATGRDEEIRALSVNKTAADQGGMRAQREADGSLLSSNGLRRETANGTREYKTLGGAWVQEAHVDRAHSRWGNDTYAQQASLSYEMRKASSDEEVEGINQRYNTLATGQGGWGMSQGQADGAFIGAGFENQNTHLEFKHMDSSGQFRDAGVTADGTQTVGGASFVKEMYEKKGSYPLANMSAHTAKQLMRVHDDENTSDETKAQIRAISETFVQRGFGGGGVITGADGEQQPAPQGTQATGAGGPSFNSQGAAHANEAWHELAQRTGVLRPGGAPNADYGYSQARDNSTPGAPQTNRQ